MKLCYFGVLKLLSCCCIYCRLLSSRATPMHESLVEIPWTPWLQLWLIFVMCNLQIFFCSSFCAILYPPVLRSQMHFVTRGYLRYSFAFLWYIRTLLPWATCACFMHILDIISVTCSFAKYACMLVTLNHFFHMLVRKFSSSTFSTSQWR